MVNIGFICEGYTELFILESNNFKALLNQLGLHSVGVINVQGNGNLLPHNIKSHRENLFKKGASVIFILTDLDQDQCITKTRLRITESENQIIIVAVKQIESWFLSDNSAMNQIFKAIIHLNILKTKIFLLKLFEINIWKSLTEDLLGEMKRKGSLKK
jgi:hypothetical protein